MKTQLFLFGKRALAMCLIGLGVTSWQAYGAGAGFVSLFNGRDLSGWKIPAGDNGHWKVVDGVIDYDALSEAAGDKSLGTEKEFSDYVLKMEWRIKETPYV